MSSCHRTIQHTGQTSGTWLTYSWHHWPVSVVLPGSSLGLQHQHQLVKSPQYKCLSHIPDSWNQKRGDPQPPGLSQTLQGCRCVQFGKPWPSLCSVLHGCTHGGFAYGDTEASDQSGARREISPVHSLWLPSLQVGGTGCCLLHFPYRLPSLPSPLKETGPFTKGTC